MAANAPTVHAILSRLEDRGLVTRGPHPDTARGVLVSLTPEGDQAVDKLFPILEHRVISRFARHFSEDELDTIMELMGRI
jgi:DNA-binding MarR family transcriptional regulator